MVTVHGTRGISVGVSTIYTWINRNQVPGITNKDLRHKGHRYKRALSARTWKSLRSSNTDKRQTIREHTIDSRPEFILNRLRFGDWELDGVESRQSNALVLTFVERKTRYAVSIKIPSKHANDIKLGIDTFMSRFQQSVRSITCDRGSEFLAASTQQCFKDYNVDYYYAHAYAPYERGSNENFNSLLRGYFPKGTDFNQVTQQELSDAVMSINQRPMKLHRFKSRLSAFKRHMQYHLRYQ